MTLQITLTPETETRLRERAAASGKDLTAIVLEAVDEKLRIPATFAEVLAPIHAATRSSGLTEDQLDALIDECRDEVHHLRNGHEPV